MGERALDQESNMYLNANWEGNEPNGLTTADSPSVVCVLSFENKYPCFSWAHGCPAKKCRDHISFVILETR